MKTRIVIGSLVGAMMTFQVLAQRSENDDMYFNSKDREKLKTEIATTSVNDKIDQDYKAFKKKNFEESEEVATENTNPTDSYSARHVNPEYISRSNAEQASEDEQNYFVEGYSPNLYNSIDNNNYAYSTQPNYQNSWYGSSLYTPSAFNSWYSPYYGYINPCMSPYYSGGSGWNLSFSYGWGNPWGTPAWNYGMSYGMGYGWGNYNPYYYPYYPSYYNGYAGYYSEASSPNYGKRPSRHSAVVAPTQRVTSSSTGGGSNGRSRQTVDEYYVKPSRRAVVTFEKPFEGYTIDRYSQPGSNQDSRTRTRDSYNTHSTYESKPSSYSTPSRGSSSGSSSSGSSSSPKPSRGRD